ncbi:hypothetical protein QE197_08560 [Arsenophonus nasoniae]|uniref:Phage tail protein C-terminal domain-containing protein n=2 Tax=Arsenophonus nasoniae TaxID=638 RepID=A0A4P7KTT0_9GAMM|nr:hypothetical protein [Arsenophonus nasoniae]QBY43455.1 hypothetical protein ArsFIN_20220 [Arsenophonus nasoniae]WGM07433.1 hypothetical protein QE258_09435 [Arsenophonus nasoniae]WGM12305.1 hypothetical protein QE197_08560 [Arsenophonus nasoniae]WGM16985.1 hypothetical protein QE193_08445 [Arsenophonus nasoniae]
MIYKDGTVTVVSGSSIVKGTGTKWNSNNPLVSPGMLMLIKNGNINYPYMILSVNSDTELTLADKPTFSATDTTYSINLTEPNNNSDAARALVAANTYILYFLQNMDTWMGENGVVELTLPSGKTVKLESIKALQELVEGKADSSAIDEIKETVKGKADAKDVVEISEKLDKKFDKTGGEINGNVQLNAGKINSKHGDKVVSHTFQDKDGTLIQMGDFGLGGTTIYERGNESITGGCGFFSNLGYDDDRFDGKWGSGIRLQYDKNSFYFLFLDGYGNTWTAIHLADKQSFKLKKQWSENNTTVDGNGFIKKASPIIKIYPNGHFETNDKSEGAIVQRLDTGKYLISRVLGYNSDGAWGVNGGVSVPKDINGLELIYVRDKILSNGNIEIQTFHRQHSHLPEDFQNWRIKEIIDGKPTYYIDGEPCDIPPSTWLDVRVEMPVDSIWNQQHAQTK